ncbi:MAG: adenylate/guanylate cyclase domain-containing protein [Leptolyngbyaceae bacterium]|nr:adenylate/guanylate cyclase domain-containing protein [Leptolyngbyaceae bacterium]
MKPRATLIQPLAALLNHGLDYWHRVSNPIRSPEYQQWRQRFLRQRLRLVLWLAILGYATFIVLELIHIAGNPAKLQNHWLVLAAIVELCLFTSLRLLKTPIGQRYPGAILLAASWSITLMEQVWATLRGVSFLGIFAWTLVFLTQATLIPVRWPLHLISQLGVFAYYGVVNTALGLKAATTSESLDSQYGLYLFWFCLISNLGVYLYERLQQNEFESRLKLQAEQDKSERLLLNILPASIASQLKQDQITIADHFPEVSVLFADIVGFTELSTHFSPIELVNLLNQIFSTFDHLAEKHGLEKIKTIGDAYMVVGGLPLPRPDHATAIADMALDMQQALTEFNYTQGQAFRIRIGINTGPVVAGVIGIKKFIYDLWGDTVNIASRMESHGVADCIQVTDITYAYLHKQYQLESRGSISIKGKGEMVTYFLKGRK